MCIHAAELNQILQPGPQLAADVTENDDWIGNFLLRSHVKKHQS